MIFSRRNHGSIQANFELELRSSRKAPETVESKLKFAQRHGSTPDPRELKRTQCNGQDKDAREYIRGTAGWDVRIP
jgi:hypothetical protein